MERMSEQEFVVKRDEYLERLPVEFRSRVGYMAWERGHSSGYEEVINILSEMVYQLEDPIREFETRIEFEAIELTMKHR